MGPRDCGKEGQWRVWAARILGYSGDWRKSDSPHFWCIGGYIDYYSGIKGVPYNSQSTYFFIYIHRPLLAGCHQAVERELPSAVCCYRLAVSVTGLL